MAATNPWGDAQTDKEAGLLERVATVVGEERVGREVEEDVVLEWDRCLAQARELHKQVLQLGVQWERLHSWARLRPMCDGEVLAERAKHLEQLQQHLGMICEEYNALRARFLVRPCSDNAIATQEGYHEDVVRVFETIARHIAAFQQETQVALSSLWTKERAERLPQAQSVSQKLGSICSSYEGLADLITRTRRAMRRLEETLLEREAEG